MSKRLAVALGFVTLLAGNAWAQLPLGPEFQVNTYTTDNQSRPAIASYQAGNFVVVWQSYGQDGSGAGIFARKFLASGTAVGPSEFRVNATTAGYQTHPRVAANASGQLVVVWRSYLQDGSLSGLFGRRYDPAGTPGPEFRVNSYTTGFQQFPGLAVDPAGNFVVAWSSDGQDGATFGIFAQRYDAAAVPQGGEFRVNTYTTSVQYGPSVAMDTAGNFVVVWSSTGQDGSGYGVFAQRYNAAGAAQGAEFRLNTYTTFDQRQPSVAMDAAGTFVVAWNSYQDGYAGAVIGRRFDASGAPLGPEFRINQVTSGNEDHPRVVAEADGSFVVAWMSDRQDGDGRGVFARAFTSSGVPQGGEFQVNAFTTGAQEYPELAAQPAGRFVVAWDSDPHDGDSYAVIGRRFATDLIFQDGFESGDLSKWSSAATDSGDLFPSATAAMKFTSVGLEGDVDDTAGLFVQDDTPLDEDRYRARFYFDTNGFDPGESSGAHRTRIFIVFEEAPTRRLAAVVLKRLGAVYSLEGRARLDDDTQADTGFFDIADGVHFVELDWKRSSSASANDGTFELWIDGVSRSTLSGLDNSRSAVDFARLGALSVKTGASGTLYWDEFESRRITFIGS